MAPANQIFATKFRKVKLWKDELLECLADHITGPNSGDFIGISVWRASTDIDSVGRNNVCVLVKNSRHPHALLSSFLYLYILKSESTKFLMAKAALLGDLFGIEHQFASRHFPI